MARTETPRKRTGKAVPAILAQPSAEAAPIPFPMAAATALAADHALPAYEVALPETALVAPAPVESGPMVDEPAAVPAESATPVEAEAPADAATVPDATLPDAIVPEDAAPAPVAAIEPVADAATAAPAAITELIDAVEPPAPAVAAPLWKGPLIMATTFDTAAAADKGKAMLGEINDRAKSAMEKSVKLGEEMTEFTKGNVEALVASSRVAAKGAEAMAQDVAETMKKNFESATATMKSFAAVKSPTELFQLQSDYAKSYFDGAVADASKFSEAMMKLLGDIAQPLSSRYALAAEKIKVAAL